MSLYLGYDKDDVGYDKGVVEPEKKEPPYETVFNINVSNAVVTPHTGRVRITKIKDGDSYFHQDTYSESPSSGDGFVKNLGSTRMLFDCPRLTTINVSIFVVFQLIGVSSSVGWSYIVGNDNGSYDKFIGYNSSSNDKISYGGGWPVGEYNCEVPSSVTRTEKHLISCHWLMSGSHIRVNDVKSSNSDFTANRKSNGATFGSIFANERFSSSSSSLNPISGKIYGLKIVSGFLEPADISKINKSMMLEYNIV